MYANNHKNQIIETFRYYRKLYDKSCVKNKTYNSFLISVLQIITQYQSSIILSKNTIGALISKICEKIYPGFRSNNLSDKLQMIVNVTKNTSQCFEEQKNNAQSSETKQYQKQISSQLMHLIMHFSCARHIPRIALILVCFVHKRLLRKQAINYVLMGMILGFENINQKQDIFIVQECLRLITQKYPSNNNVFMFISSIIYYNKFFKQQNFEFIRQLINFQYQITAMVLKFRKQSVNDQTQNCIIACDRQFCMLVPSIIDNLVIKALIDMVQNPKLQQIQQKIAYILTKIIRYDMSIMIVKNLIRKLQIAEINGTKSTWKKVFEIMRICLTTPAFNHQSLQFQSKKSYLKIGGLQKVSQVIFRYRSYRLESELMLFKMKSSSVKQFDEIWVTIRYVQEKKFFISMLYIKNKSVISFQKKQLIGRMFEDNQATISINSQTTVIKLQGESCIDISISQFTPKSLTIGDTDQIDNFICEVSFLKLIRNSQQIDMLKFYNQNPKFLKQSCKSVKFIIKKSMSHLLELLGDLELIMLIISHLLKKIDNNQLLTQMLYQVMDFLSEIAYVKGVIGLKVCEKQRQKRICNVSCLSWIACRYKRHGKPIIELLKFLSIRKYQNQVDNLEVLCNFSLLKQLKYIDFKLILDKIDEDMESLLKKQENSKQIYRYCQKMALDLTIIFKNTLFVSENMQEDALHKHCHIIKIIYSKIVKFVPYEILQFILFLLKILYILIDRRKQNDYIDTTMGFELSNLALQLSKYLFKNNCISKSKLEQKYEMNQYSQILAKKQQITIWVRQILYCLENEILYDEQNIIKYYKWNEDEPNEKYGKLCSTNQSQLIDLCEKIQIYTISGDIIQLQRMIFEKPSQNQINQFWQINLIQVNIQQPKLFEQRLKFLMKYGPYGKKTQIKNSKIIENIIKKSFEFVKIRNYWKLPRQFIQSFHLINFQQFLQTIFKIYQLQLDDTALNKQIKCRLGENMLYLIYNLPKAYFSNTVQIREYTRKWPKLAQILDILENHLIIKEIAAKVQKLQNQPSKTHQILSKIELFNDNSSQTQSEFSEDETNPCLQQYIKKNKLQICTEGLKTQKIRRSFQQIQLLVNRSEIKNLQIKNNNSECSQQHINTIVENFQINLQTIINLFSSQSNITVTQKISQFKSSMFFIKTHIYKFSCMIIDSYIFQSLKIQIVSKQSRKKSISVERSHILQQQSQRILDEYLTQRRNYIHKIQKFWANVQKNNKYFWEIFSTQENKHQSLDYLCSNGLKSRGLVKIDNQKREIQLPKGVFNKSFKNSISVSSDRQMFTDDISQDSMFSGSNLYDLQSSYEQKSHSHSPNKKHSQQQKKKKLKKINEFSVMYITTTTIYQGILYAEKNILRFQQQIPDHNLYDLICANEHERRSYFQYEKCPKTFQITINKKTSIIPKRYLNFQTSLQLFSEHKSFMFWFRKGINRQKFLKNYEHLQNIIHNDDKIKQAAKKLMRKWQNGDISNFTYLMHLNDLGSRSFNDLSQYYIFPWTVINFQDKMDSKFFENSNNFRDLTKPVGALNAQRLSMLREKLKESMKYSDMPKHLYGSFYSNPAIVCNYMVRMQPFSYHHFLLQKNQFDLADRIFHSFEDQFKGCYENSGDYKELIPQFYFFPEFLRNRSEYNFGYRQNKQIVNNVQLPKWNKGEFLPEQSFIFGMRKALQSQIVTKSLHNWIDLVFGIYAQKDKGIEKDNLFIDSIYRQKLKQIDKKNKDRQLCLVMYKQFGQVPRQLFYEQHQPSSKQNQNYSISKCKPCKIFQKVVSHQNSTINILNTSQDLIWIDSQQKLVYAAGNHGKYQKIEEIKLNSDKQQQKTQISYTNKTKSYDIRCFKIQSIQGKQMQFVVYSHLKQLCLVQMGITQIRRKKQIKQQIKMQIPLVANIDLLQIYEDLNLLIVAEKSNFKIYSYQYHTKKLQNSLLKKKGHFTLNILKQFTQHRSPIILIKICTSYGLLISLDSSHKIFILKLQTDQISVTQSFKLKKLSFCQSVIDMKIHEMGFINILTTHHTVYIYNFMGDLVARLETQNIEQFELKKQFITCFDIWNHQTSQIVVGTNLGNLYMIDCIYNNHCEKINIGKGQIREVSVTRIGRHWECICFCFPNIYRIASPNFQKACRRRK